MRYKYVPCQYTEYQYVLLCHSIGDDDNDDDDDDDVVILFER